MSTPIDRHESYAVCGITIAALSPASAASSILDHALSGCSYEVHLCNAFTLSLVPGDDELQTALDQADLNLPDGSPVAWAGRRHGTIGPVRGPGLVVDVVKAGVQPGLRHYFYGGAEGIADQLCQQLSGDNPGVQIVGRETPPWTDLEQDGLHALANRIKAARAQVVWIGLGTPRQDYLVRRLAPLVDCAVVPVGAAFDFLAGTVAEAPSMLHGTGLEWLHRLYKEPRRLWRRYLLGNPRFVYRAMQARRHR